MKTIREVLQHCANYLGQKGIERSRREAEDLLSDALTMSRVELYMDHDRPLTEAELGICRDRLVRRGRGEPLAYIHGEVQFCDCQINVNPRVLIPRQETEILVDLVVKELVAAGPETGVLWDVCCGSGCIGIAIKRALPKWTVVAADISAAALEVARGNAKRNGVEIDFRQGDLLQPFAGEKAQVVVANPPYIAQADYARLEREVLDYEPQHALLGGTTGIEYYQRLVPELPARLNRGGRVWFEIGDGQGAALATLFSAAPWKKAEIKRDWAGKERFFSLEIE